MAFLQSAKPFNVPQAIQRGLDFQRQGKLAEAEKLFTDVIAVRPDYFEALNMLGLIKLHRRDFVGALRMMGAALQARPRSPEVLLNYGLVLNELGRHDEALVTFDLVLSIKRNSVEAHNNRGAVLERLGRDAEALACFERALAVKSNHVDALYNMASVLRKLTRYDEALKYFDRVLLLKPDHVNAHNNRGLALDGLNRPEDALAGYDRALKLAPRNLEALNNRGNVLQKLSRHSDAIACYDFALTINSGHPEVLNNRGRSLSILGQHREGLNSTLRATAAKPDYVDAHWNASLMHLRLGEFQNGWKKYEWRWKRGEGLKKLRIYPQPLWLGETPAAGKTILVHHEPGFGDTIQFARYASLLAQQGAKVVLEVQPPLKALLSQIAGVEVIGNGDPIPEFDMHCPLMSLPLAFGTTIDTIPADVPYLAAPASRTERLEALLPPRQGLRIGLVWSGNATHKDDHNRSISLARLGPLLEAPGVQFVSLQKELRDADAQLLAQDARMTDLGRHFGDFDDTAAAIDLVDLVISVDTSVAHLAGAMGKPVWVVLPFCPDWRWLLERDDNPWYPTARLFRQPAIGDWDSVIARLTEALAQRASGGADG
jgi:tetratricopeptide (TPR) repeat protein